jgi:hypothetical protein
MQAVEIRQTLQIGLVFQQFFGAAMQQANVAIDTIHQLAIKVHDHSQHTMRSGMLRTKVQREGTIFAWDRFDVVSH